MAEFSRSERCKGMQAGGARRSVPGRRGRAYVRRRDVHQRVLRGRQRYVAGGPYCRQGSERAGGAQAEAVPAREEPARGAYPLRGGGPRTARCRGVAVPAAARARRGADALRGDGSRSARDLHRHPEGARGFASRSRAAPGGCVPPLPPGACGVAAFGCLLRFGCAALGGCSSRLQGFVPSRSCLSRHGYRSPLIS